RLGGVKAIAILEDWCPDAHRGLPIMAKIAQASGMELRVFYRDKNPDVINLYLNQGKFQSIPVFAFFNKDLKPLCHWIERPAVATRFTEEVLAELTKKKLSEDEIRQERRKRNATMSDSWRQETVKELKELLAKVAPKSP
ncbi:MAG: thioredoxin family protein, partial [Chloroflexota bacterium]